MKSKVLLPAYILILFLQACTKEDSMLNSPLHALMEHTENELSLNFINQMQKQEGSYQAFLSELQGATPLYEYIELAIAKDFGLYYAIPYTDKSNIVTGCICVPVERSSNSDNFLTPDGNLKQPIKMDLQKFNEDIPITRRYLYSTQFQRWQTRGLRVEQAFVDFAELLQKTDVFIPTSNSDKLFGESKQTKGYIGTVFRITISYQVYTYSTGYTAIAYDLSQLGIRFEQYLRTQCSLSGYMDISLNTLNNELIASLYLSKKESLYGMQQYLDGFFNHVYSQTNLSPYIISFQTTYCDILDKQYYNDGSWPILNLPNFTPISSETSSGSGTGGSGGKTGSIPTEKSIPPSISSLFVSVSNLSEEEIHKLDSVIKNIKAYNPYGSLFDYTTTKLWKFKQIKIGKGYFTQEELENGATAKYMLESGTLCLTEITGNALLHEHFHLFQRGEMGNKYNNEFIGMMDAELMLYFDIVNRVLERDKKGDIIYDVFYNYSQTPLISERDSNHEKYESYSKWIKDITKKNKNYPTSIDNIEANEFIQYYFKKGEHFYSRNYQYESAYPYNINKALSIINKK